MSFTHNMLLTTTLLYHQDTDQAPWSGVRNKMPPRRGISCISLFLFGMAAILVQILFLIPTTEALFTNAPLLLSLCWIFPSPGVPYQQFLLAATAVYLKYFILLALLITSAAGVGEMKNIFLFSQNISVASVAIFTPHPPPSSPSNSTTTTGISIPLYSKEQSLTSSLILAVSLSPSTAPARKGD